MQPVPLWTDAVGEVVFLYSQFLAAKRKKEKLGWVSWELGPIPCPCGETAGAALKLFPGKPARNREHSR